MANCDFLNRQTPFAKAGKQLSFIPNILLIINGNMVYLPTLNLLFFMCRHAVTELRKIPALQSPDSPL
ncbi:hypothetical protein Peur_028600 [Populus x canadensis]